MKIFVLCLAILLCIGIYFDFVYPRLLIEPRLRSLGYNGKIEIYNGYVPCGGAVPAGNKDGCYDTRNGETIIRINGLLPARRAKFVLTHEFCHYKLKIIDENKADECAFALLKQL